LKTKHKERSMNNLVNKLNEAGYKNTNTNRERAVKNLNLLLDSGIMDIKFINSNEYNCEENGKAYWYKTADGKQRCTAYIVTLYGKKYYGHFMAKSTRSVQFGIECINKINHFSLDINAIQLRVSKLISIIKDRGDFLKPEFMKAKGICSCGKCNGIGIIPQFSYYANGVCFDCGGSGINRNTLKQYIETSIDMAKNDIK